MSKYEKSLPSSFAHSAAQGFVQSAAYLLQLRHGVLLPYLVAIFYVGRFEILLDSVAFGDETDGHIGFANFGG